MGIESIISDQRDSLVVAINYRNQVRTELEEKYGLSVRETRAWQRLTIEANMMYKELDFVAKLEAELNI